MILEPQLDLISCRKQKDYMQCKQNLTFHNFIFLYFYFVFYNSIIVIKFKK